ncbi:MAG: hypothetical protein M3Z24_05570 [Chloroflexota bacterium]|nr:hypothetical protein [Chloroflexota bacterium]
MDRIQHSHDGARVDDLVGIATMGVYAAINIRETISPQGLIPRVGYPKLRVEHPRVRVTLHTDNLAQAQGEDAQARDWLVAMGKHTGIGETKPTIELLVTPARSGQGTEWFSPLALTTYDIECIPGSFKRLYGLSLNPNWEKMRLPNEPSAPFVDVMIHQALERHLFVTLDQSILNLALIAQPQGNVFVLTPCEAQHYIDLSLKAHEKYHIRTNHTANKSWYYWQRLWNLVPAFQTAWPYAVYGDANGLPCGTPIMDFMQALYARLIGQMQACDRIGWLRYGIPTSNARDEMLNQLNYFFMLSTGVFDSLAWLALHRFSLRAGNRLDVTLRAERPIGQENRFFRQLDTATPHLASFLRDHHRQNRIALFYAPRDTVQHRLVLTGAHFNTGQVISDCNIAFLSREDGHAIQTVDRMIPENMPFTEWGLITLSDAPDKILLEPYRFTCTALRFLFPFVSEVLSRLDFPRWIGAHPPLKEAADTTIAFAQSQNNLAFDVPYP